MISVPQFIFILLITYNTAQKHTHIAAHYSILPMFIMLLSFQFHMHQHIIPIDTFLIELFNIYICNINRPLYSWTICFSSLFFCSFVRSFVCSFLSSFLCFCFLFVERSSVDFFNHHDKNCIKSDNERIVPLNELCKFM